MTIDKPYEVIICIFRRDPDCSIDDTLLANTTLSFTAIEDAIVWCDKAGVVFK